MSKDTEQFEFGRIKAKKNEDQTFGCLLKVGYDCLDTYNNPQVAKFVDDVLDIAVKGEVKFLNRVSVPWDTVRQNEREARKKAEEELAISSKIDAYIRNHMSQWYQDHCLMEMPYKDNNISIGLAQANISKEIDCKFVFESMLTCSLPPSQRGGTYY